ncbi:ATP-binding protein [Dyadobacter pollutisoli]|uniref:AAA family ATPase n=1 Tax=Dyadobacter pollutisoli TaxID=2910158 RepID=A0A9E8N8T1_9BACT|nr:AAA family ATPase [Dyadobacter pollutisoli]WAC11438.1 AAA family ATPase [Dyadobacter pollutisoli]
MEIPFTKYLAKLQRTSTKFVRDMIHQIDWEHNRLIGIKGARGAGKTTLVLQYLKQMALPSGQTLYVSLDDLYFSAHRLYDLGETFVKTGGKLLVLDEVHRYANWSQEIKNLYDDFPNLRIVFTGSSIMHLERSKGDLSRRAVMYHLHGLSFREFLQIQDIVSWPAITLSDLLSGHMQLALDLTQTIKPLAHWNDYLQHGYYPYFLENKEVYAQKLTETIQLSLELDLPAVYGISYASVDKLKQLLVVLAESVPLKPNVSKLSETLNTSRALVVEYMHYLEELGVLMLLHRDSSGITRLQKPEKVYLSHPNLQYALHQSRPDMGTLRESFFLSQVQPLHKVEYTEKGDFKLDRQITIEVGGANKSRQQLVGLEDAYVAADGIEVGYGSKVPLWMFGMLY